MTGRSKVRRVKMDAERTLRRLLLMVMTASACLLFAGCKFFRDPIIVDTDDIRPEDKKVLDAAIPIEWTDSAQYKSLYCLLSPDGHYTMGARIELPAADLPALKQGFAFEYSAPGAEVSEELRRNMIPISLYRVELGNLYRGEEITELYESQLHAMLIAVAANRDPAIVIVVQYDPPAIVGSLLRD